MSSYLRKALQLPPGLAARKARELISYRWRRYVRKARDRFAPDPLSDEAFRSRLRPDTVLDAGSLFRSAGAVLPVAEVALPSPPAQLRAEILAVAGRALEHRFSLLGSGDVRVDYELRPRGVEGRRYRGTPGADAAAAQRARMERLLASSAESYDPIDWHRDFKSGFRWTDAHVADLQYGDVPGVDIKVPWDLSRFQDVGALGLAWRLGPSSSVGSRAPREFRSRIVDWIAANPLRRGPNWLCPMDVAIRAVNWLIGMALMSEAAEVGEELRLLLAKSLDAHGRHIESHLEYHSILSGNHYLANVVGLLCIGAALPELEDSDRWLLWGMQELVSEMQRQVRPDGADFEGSTGYHFLVSELFLIGTAVASRIPSERRHRLARTPGGPVAHPRAPALRPAEQRGFDLTRPEIFPASYLDRLVGMAELALSLTKPNGRIPLVGDFDSGRLYCLVPGEVHDRRSVLAVAGRLFGREDFSRAGSEYVLDAHLVVGDHPVGGVGSRTVPRRVIQHGPLELRPDSGLAIVREPERFLLVSFATVPPGSSGGHYHNDLLSFELQWHGVDFIVDGGSYLYTPVPELRNAWRSTAAHSTVHVPGREQRSWPREPGSLFRISRDARTEVLEAQANSLRIRCAYPGVVHERQWEWTDDQLIIEDIIEVEDDRHPELVFNLAPGAQVRRAEGAAGPVSLSLERDGIQLGARIDGVSTFHLAEGFYSPGYGERRPNTRIVAPLEAGRARTQLVLDGRP